MTFRDEKQKRNPQIFAFKRMKEKTASLESNRHWSEIILSAVKTMLSFPGTVIVMSFETWTRTFSRAVGKKNPQTPKKKKRGCKYSQFDSWSLLERLQMKCESSWLAVFLISLSLQLFIQSWTQEAPARIPWTNDTNGFLAAIQGKTVIRTFKNWWFLFHSLKKTK